MDGRADASFVEAVAIFNTADTLQDAIDDLMNSGFDRADLSLLPAQNMVEARLGHSYQTTSELEDDPAVPRTYYLERESVGDAEGALVGGLLYVGALSAAGAIFAYGGSLATAIGAAILGGGTGALIGTFFARRVDRLYSRHMQEHLVHGGLLLWVRTPDTGKMKRAVEILFKHSGRDVHVHALPTAA
ncbi:MAG TPA: hypothetical protein VLZ74_16325 [Methylocella sp.]|nr:hypothetical protein [Methylocella sp.]